MPIAFCNNCGDPYIPAGPEQYYCGGQTCAKADDYHRARYILMRHSNTADNHAYLYGTARIIETVGEGTAAVDIVQVVGDDTGEDRAEYLAQYQLGRLQSGLEARSNQVFRRYSQALEEAKLVVETLSR